MVLSKSISGLLVLCSVSAACLGSMLFPTQLVANCIVLASFGLILLATINILGSRGESRFARATFAATGCVYLLLSLGPWFAIHVEPRMPTSRAINKIYHLMFPKLKLYPNADLDGDGVLEAHWIADTTTVLLGPDGRKVDLRISFADPTVSPHFDVICHSYLSVVIAWGVSAFTILTLRLSKFLVGRTFSINLDPSVEPSTEHPYGPTHAPPGREKAL